jgi:hypothetical protein
MKVKINTYNGELPDYLTDGKEYVFTISDSGKGGTLVNDYGDLSYINLECSCHLNEGSWEIVK